MCEFEGRKISLRELLSLCCLVCVQKIKTLYQLTFTRNTRA